MKTTTTTTTTTSTGGCVDVDDRSRCRWASCCLSCSTLPPPSSSLDGEAVVTVVVALEDPIDHFSKGFSVDVVRFGGG
jgi:hypothetical protein